MSRFEGEIRAADKASVDPIELLAALSSGSEHDDVRRQAIACFLSGGQGWRDAATRLDGTFAARAEAGTGLTGGKGK